MLQMTLMVAGLCLCQVEASSDDQWIAKYKEVRVKEAERQAKDREATIENRKGQVKTLRRDFPDPNERGARAKELKAEIRKLESEVQNLRKKGAGLDPRLRYADAIPGQMGMQIDCDDYKFVEVRGKEVILEARRARYACGGFARQANFVGYEPVGYLVLTGVDPEEVAGKNELPSGLYVVHKKTQDSVTAERVLKADEVKAAFPSARAK